MKLRESAKHISGSDHELADAPQHCSALPSAEETRVWLTHGKHLKHVGHIAFVGAVAQ
jgi:hypothetical protein